MLVQAAVLFDSEEKPAVLGVLTVPKGRVDTKVSEKHGWQLLLRFRDTALEGQNLLPQIRTEKSPTRLNDSIS